MKQNTNIERKPYNSRNVFKKKSNVIHFHTLNLIESLWSRFLDKRET